MLFAERSRPGTSWWVIGTIVVGCTAIAYGSMLGRTAGTVVLVVGGAIVIALVTMATWSITLTDDQLRVAGRSVPTSQITGATALDPEAARHLAGPGADARAWLRLRGGKPGVRIDVDDASCPYWLVSTRRAPELADAITGLVGRGPDDAAQ